MYLFDFQELAKFLTKQFHITEGLKQEDEKGILKSITAYKAIPCNRRIETPMRFCYCAGQRKLTKQFHVTEGLKRMNDLTFEDQNGRLTKQFHVTEGLKRMNDLTFEDQNGRLTKQFHVTEGLKQ